MVGGSESKCHAHIPLCVSDDPLNSSGGIKENDVNIIKVQSGHDLIVRVFVDSESLLCLLVGHMYVRKGSL